MSPLARQGDPCFLQNNQQQVLESSLHGQDAFGNPISAAGLQCQLSFAAAEDSAPANINQLCLADEDDASSLRAILYTERTGNYSMFFNLQEPGGSIMHLTGIAFLSANPAGTKLSIFGGCSCQKQDKACATADVAVV